MSTRDTFTLEVPVRAEWLQSLSSRKADSRCIKMMIIFNNTINERSKSMYTSFCESWRSLDHRSTLSHYSRPISWLPLATTLIHYLSLSSVLPNCRCARVFIALPGRAHACPLPGADNAPPPAPAELITSSVSPRHVRARPDLPVTWPPRDTGMRWPRTKLDRFQHRTSLQVAAPGQSVHMLCWLSSNNDHTRRHTLSMLCTPP